MTSPHDSIRVTTQSPEQTVHLGFLFAGSLIPGDCILLRGHIGAGKTCLAKGIAAGLGVKDVSSVHSPSFTLINRYEGDIPIYHVDLYRLEMDSAIDDIEFEDLWNESAVILIEWPDIAIGRIPRVNFQIEILWPMVRQTEREIVISVSDQGRIEQLKRQIDDHFRN